MSSLILLPVHLFQIDPSHLKTIVSFNLCSLHVYVCSHFSHLFIYYLIRCDFVKCVLFIYLFGHPLEREHIA
jgi:hypothetical protein